MARVRGATLDFVDKCKGFSFLDPRGPGFTLPGPFILSTGAWVSQFEGPGDQDPGLRDLILWTGARVSYFYGSGAEVQGFLER